MHINPELLLTQMYASLVDFAIMTTDLDARITSWNVGACQIFGYSADQIIGRSTAITFTQEDINLGQPYLEMAVASQHGRAADYRWHVRRDRSLFWADGVLTAIHDEDGQVVGFLKILRDITERKLAQDEVARVANVDNPHRSVQPGCL